MPRRLCCFYVHVHGERKGRGSISGCFPGVGSSKVYKIQILYSVDGSAKRGQRLGKAAGCDITGRHSIRYYVNHHRGGRGVVPERVNIRLHADPTAV